MGEPGWSSTGHGRNEGKPSVLKSVLDAGGGFKQGRAWSRSHRCWGGRSPFCNSLYTLYHVRTGGADGQGGSMGSMPDANTSYGSVAAGAPSAAAIKPLLQCWSSPLGRGTAGTGPGL